ncbi:universal stress protein [Georgenia sp. SUBG003]|uniref:universal stress protein n=1 Tax=Georgenia sp. SUBG003 TaxID=1497974 RepID=UPI0004D91303|nr:universal stress protein UspA [Georgenia sp. SUBG003]
MTIVVGMVPTPAARAALEAATEEAALRGSRLVVVNAVRSGAYVDADVLGDEERQAVAERLTARGVDHEIRRLDGEGDTVDQILKVAQETGADMLVIGMRRRSPVGKFLMGSSAQRLLLDAPCPVLAVKQPR